MKNKMVFLILLKFSQETIHLVKSGAIKRGGDKKEETEEKAILNAPEKITFR